MGAHRAEGLGGVGGEGILGTCTLEKWEVVVVVVVPCLGSALLEQSREESGFKAQHRVGDSLQGCTRGRSWGAMLPAALVLMAVQLRPLCLQTSSDYFACCRLPDQ